MPENIRMYNTSARIAVIGTGASQQLESLRLPEIPETTYQNPKTMNINRKWKDILSQLGIQAGKDVEIDDRMLDAIDEKLGSQARRIEELENGEAKDKAAAHLTKLQHRISELEAQNARLNAKATFIPHREDPSPAANDTKVSSLNQNAYQEDVRGFSK